MTSRVPTGHPVLTERALNRALLDRQMLLERSSRPVADTVRHLVGLQAQAPWSPYHALWSRLDPFDPHELGAMLTDRRAVRIAIMRSTVHLVTAEDCRFLRPLHAAFLERALLTSTWRTGLDDLDLGAVVAAGRALVEEQPLTFRELGVRLVERWPERDPATLAQAVRALAPLVQLPPRAVWGRTGQVVVTTAEHWLGAPLDEGAALDEMVLRYLAAFGPASVMDVQAWSGLTRLKEVTDRLGDRVRRFRNEAGRELLDLPDAPRPDPDTPAPVRFLPDYDNVVLSHADRSRIVDDDVRRRVQRVDQVLPGTVLVDGRVAAMWSVDRAKGAAALVVTPLRPLTGTERTAVGDEGARLLAFTAAEADDHDVRIVDPHA
ncbi:MAG TPA: winged helix DNA-binding domain-containing protein [Acidimicrobiales bacterium]|nr:winged helix DNA-binding domain-containing protein [Acidimicrobiales bacterium]